MNLNSLDYLVIIILALGVIRGNFQGLVGAVGGVLTNIVSLVVAWIFRQDATNYLEDQFGIVSILVKIVERRLSLPIDSINQGQIIQILPLDQALASLHSQITEFSYLFVSIFCFLLLYITSSCMLSLIFLCLTRIMKYGVIGSANRVGGIALVTARNIVIMAAIAGVIYNPIILGAEIGLNNANRLQAWLEQSFFFPYLFRIWGIMLSMLGIGA